MAITVCAREAKITSQLAAQRVAQPLAPREPAMAQRVARLWLALLALGLSEDIMPNVVCSYKKMQNKAHGFFVKLLG